MTIRDLVRPVIRGPARSILERRGGGFSPRALWPLSTTAGMWLDQSDSGTVFQDSTATTVGVIDSPVGYRIDKRLDVASGTEIIPTSADQTGSSDTGYWTKDAGVTVSSGFNWPNLADGRQLYRPLALTAGVLYRVTWTISSLSAGGMRIYAGGNTGPVRSAAGTYTEYIVCGTTNTTLSTFNVGTTTATVSSISWKPVAGNHVLQATTAARPTWKSVSAIVSDLMDGTDDGYSVPVFAAGTLTSDMDCFIAIKRNALTQTVVVSEIPSSGTRFYGTMINGSAGLAASGVGTLWSYFVDGVQIGGVNTTTAGQLHTAIGSGTWHVMEVRNLNLVAWTQFTLGLYAAFMLNADIGGVILCPAQSADNRNKTRKWLGAKVGLSL